MADERHVIANATDAKRAGALVRRIFTSGIAHVSIRLTIPSAELVSTSDILMDMPNDKALCLIGTSIKGDERGPTPNYYTGGAMRMPMVTEDNATWAQIDGIGFWDFGHGIALTIAGVAARPIGATLIDPAIAIANTPTPFIEALRKTLSDVGWIDHDYHAVAHAFLHGDENGVDLDIELGVERGPGATHMRYELSVRPQPQAVFPPWPEADTYYDPDSFIRAIVPDWPEDRSLLEWWRDTRS